MAWHPNGYHATTARAISGTGTAEGSGQEAVVDQVLLGRGVGARPALVPGRTEDRLKVGGDVVLRLGPPDLGIGNSLPYVVEYGGMPNDIPQDNTFTRTLTLTSTTGGDITGGNVSVCSGTNSTVLTSTAAVSGVTIVRWEYSLDNFLTAGVPIANTSATYTATNLTQTTYFRSIANGNSCSASPSSATKITVGNSVAGNISADYTSVCNGTAANLSLAGNVGNILKWQSSPDNSTWTDISNTTALYTTPALSTGTYYYRAQVQNSGCTLIATTSSITITATAGSGSVGGTLSGASLCTSTNSTTLTLTGYTGVIQKWQSSTNGGATWTDIVNTAATYAITNLAVSSNYRVSVKNASCNAVYSSVGVVTVSSLPTVSAITGAASVCAGSTVTLADATSSGAWSSDNTTTATIDVNGIVTGVAAGSAVISYAVTNSGGCTTTVTKTITVNAIPAVASITGTVAVCVGGTTGLLDATSGGLWKSSNTSVATIDVSGNVTGVNAGLATISYTYTNVSGCTNTVIQTVDVYDLPVVDAITGMPSVCAGSTTGLADATPDGVWASSNVSVAMVDVNGVVTGVSGGTSDISYSVTNGNGCTQSSILTVTVNDLPVVPAITGTPDVCIGTSSTLSDVTTGGVWGSLNTAVATIDVNGSVTGISGGTADMTYTVTNGNGCTQSATQTVTVSTLPVVAAVTGSTSLCVSSKIKLSDLTPGGFWASSNTAVATVDPTGFVTGVAAGTADINYNVVNGNGCAQTATLTITINGIPTVEAITGTATVCTNMTTPLSDIISGGLWSSSDASVATVDANGLVTGISAGSSDITYTVINGGGCSNAVLQAVTVNSQPVVPALTGNSAVCTGNTITLSDAITGGAWSSSNQTVAKVDASGNVTGVTPGSADIIYTITVGSGCSNAVTQTISVMDPPDVAAIAGSVTVVAGNTTTLNDATTGGVWTSGNTSVATVDANGIVTGVAPGNAVISYDVTNAGGCDVSVSLTISTVDRPAFTAAPLVVDSVYYVGNPQNPSTPIDQIVALSGSSLTYYNAAAGGSGSSVTPNLPATPGTYTYWVSQTVDGVESARASFKVTIVTPDVFVPKVFTPNGDGINDVIKPIIPGLQQFRFFKIYNRWGNLVYQSQDANQGWDGTFKGAAQPKESYLWMIEGVDMNGQVKRYSGMITLFR